MTIEIIKNGNRCLIWTAYDRDDFCRKVGVYYTKISSIQEAKGMSESFDGGDGEYEEKQQADDDNYWFKASGDEHYINFFRKHGPFYEINSKDESFLVVNHENLKIEDEVFEIACNIEESTSDSIIEEITSCS